MAHQFIDEAYRIGIDDIEHSRDGKFSKKIVVANYQRLHYFDPKDFECLVLDESSILKNFKGKYKGLITSFVKELKYRFLSTATPSPNDFIELGTSAEALGHMGYMDMLSKFFKNNQNTSDSNNTKNLGNKYYLNPHAKDDFFRWVNQWSIMAKKPSDLGQFDDERYKLPDLIINDHVINNTGCVDAYGQTTLLPPVAKGSKELRFEEKQTVTERCEKAVECSLGKTSVYWCNLNNEGDLLDELDSGAIQVKGSQSIEEKEDILVSFSKGEIDRLITKAKITSFGLNWQHCNHTTVFPTHSYESFYQLVRRFYRFGQQKSVTVDRISSNGMQRVLQSLDTKQKQSEELYTELVSKVNSSYTEKITPFANQVIKPSFI